MIREEPVFILMKAILFLEIPNFLLNCLKHSFQRPFGLDPIFTLEYTAEKNLKFWK